MSGGILGFGRLWPVVPGQPEDEATPVGLAPGQVPVDPRRDGMAQPTAAGKGLSRSIGDFIHGGPAPMEPTLTEYQQGAEFQPGQTRRPGLLPITTDAQTGQLMLAMPKWADVLGSATPSAVGSALAPVARAAGETVLGSGPIRAYHGSPHSFDRFDVSKLGSGEGAQVFGHGLYFADKEAVARSYRDTLAPTSFLADGVPIVDDAGRNIARSVLLHDTPIDDIIANQARGLQELQASGLYRDHIPELTRALERAKELRGSKLDSSSQGHMYEVAIDADPKSFLNYDQPVAKQNLPSLRDAMRPDLQSSALAGQEAEVLSRLRADPRWQGAWDEDRTWRHLREAYPRLSDAAAQTVADGAEQIIRGSRSLPSIDASMTGGGLINVMNKMHGPAEAAKILHDGGIPGVRYFDAASRVAGQGSSNTVTFGDDIVSILRKYGIAGAAGAGGAAAALAPDDAQAAPAIRPFGALSFPR